MIAFTDYPFTELGDIPHKHAPVREVLVLGFDGNKYATIRCEGKTLSVKSGYLYSDRSLKNLTIMPESFEPDPKQQ